MRRLRVGQQVRIEDPARTAARFWVADRRAIMGAGGVYVPRVALDGIGTVAMVAVNGTRGCVEFSHTPTEDGYVRSSLWLDADALVSAAVRS